MSASSKKKLRSEQESAKLTERQIAEQKEAKKLKLYTIGFVAVLAVFLAVAIFVGVSQTISTSGIRERNTVAMTVGDREVSNSDLNYFFIGSINQFYSENGSYASIFGPNTSMPLDQQVIDAETGDTWADYFLEAAKSTAKSVYTMSAAAKAEGVTLTEAEAANVDSNLKYVELYASIYGYKDAQAYLKAMYGNGATEESYRDYLECSILADSYYNAYGNSLTYDDAALREKEAENFAAYSAFSYNYYYLSTSKFLEGGTTDEEGKTTYSDEEKAASVEAAEVAAKALVSEDVVTVEDFDAAIAGLSINAASETPVSSTLYEDTAYTSIASVYSEWLTDEARVEGDKTYIPYTSTTTSEDGTETTTTNGYYVLYFRGTNDNNFAMKNVRHILVSFEGGVTDESGNTVYSDAEKSTAKAEAEAILKEWQDGEATQDSFAALANEKSDDGDGTTGGLYENIIPTSNYVENFLNWALDDHDVGDTGIVETEYGYHVMYFVGNSEQTYRDYMIHNALASADLAAWYEAMLEPVTVTDGNTSYINKSIVLSSGT